MKINKIQNNNTNFKMALKINPKLRADIEKRGLGYTKDLEKLGKDVKDVKLFNICYEDNLYTPKIKSVNPNDKKDYLQAFTNEESKLGKFYYVTCGDETFGGYNPDEPQLFKFLFGDKAPEKYKKFKQLTGFGKLAELTRLLEEKELKKISDKKAKEIEENAAKSKEEAKKLELKTAVDDLINNYQ